MKIAYKECVEKWFVPMFGACTSSMFAILIPDLFHAIHMWYIVKLYSNLVCSALDSKLKLFRIHIMQIL